MHLLQSFGNEPEGFAEARLQRALQLLLDRGAHLVELGLVALLQRAELLLQRVAQFAEAELDRARQVGELLLRQLRHLRDLPAEALQLLALQPAEAGHLLHQAGLQFVQARTGLHAQRRRGRIHRLAQFTLQPFVAARQDIEALHQHRRPSARSQCQEDRQQQHDQHGRADRNCLNLTHEAMIRAARQLPADRPHPPAAGARPVERPVPHRPVSQPMMFAARI